MEADAREAIESNTPEVERSDLDWSPEEKAAMDGSADAEADAQESIFSAPGSDGEEDGAGQVADAATSGPTEDDPATFIDTRERKESYTPDEYARLVRQRDYFQNQTTRLTDEIGVVTERVGQIQTHLEKREEPPAPTKADDPAGYIEEKIDGVSERVEEVAQGIQQDREMAAAATHQTRFMDASEKATMAHIEATGQTREQFLAKAKALRTARYEDFLDEGFQEKEAWGLLVGWENKVITSAFQRGENPAVVMERMFQRRGLPIPAPETLDGSGNAPPLKQPTDGPSATELVTRAREGVRAETTPNESGIVRGKSFKLTYDLLSKMPPEEFNEVMDKIEGTSMEAELDSVGATRVVL